MQHYCKSQYLNSFFSLDPESINIYLLAKGRILSDIPQTASHHLRASSASNEAFWPISLPLRLPSHSLTPGERCKNQPFPPPGLTSPRLGIDLSAHVKASVSSPPGKIFSCCESLDDLGGGLHVCWLCLCQTGSEEMVTGGDETARGGSESHGRNEVAPFPHFPNSGWRIQMMITCSKWVTLKSSLFRYGIVWVLVWHVPLPYTYPPMNVSLFNVGILCGGEKREACHCCQLWKITADLSM